MLYFPTHNSNIFMLFNFNVNHTSIGLRFKNMQKSLYFRIVFVFINFFVIILYDNAFFKVQCNHFSSCIILMLLLQTNWLFRYIWPEVGLFLDWKSGNSGRWSSVQPSMLANEEVEPTNPKIQFATNQAKICHSQPVFGANAPTSHGKKNIWT